MKKIIFTVVLALLTLTISAQLSNLTPKNGVGSSNPGTSDNPYLISSVSDLTSLRSAVAQGSATVAQPTTNMFFEMTNDIDVSGSDWNMIGGNATTNAFKGTFDGKGFKIMGLKAGSATARVSKGYFGFFGYTLSATIKNVSFTNVSFYLNSNYAVGTICSSSYATNILNCSVEGIIDLSSAGSNYVGGVVGTIYTETNVLNCSVNMTLKNTSSVAYVYTGGVVGSIGDATACAIINCSAKGFIYGYQTGNASNNKLVLGGILGIAGTGDPNFKVINCLAGNSIYGETPPSGTPLTYYDGDRLISGIGNSRYKGAGTSEVNNCIAICPSLQLKSDSLAIATYGVKRIWRVYAVPVLSQQTNLTNNYAKDDMTLQSGVALNPVVLLANLSNGTNLGTTDYVTLLNNYVASHPNYLGIELKPWSTSGNLITGIASNSYASKINVAFNNGALRLTGLELGDKIAIFDVAGKTVWSGIAKANEELVNLKRGCYIVDVTNAKSKFSKKVLW